MDRWQVLCRAFESAWPAERYRDVGVVVGCSGGADSVATLHVLTQLRRNRRDLGEEPKGFVVAAHFDHGLRGSESDGDAEFVRALADELGVRFEIAQGSEQVADEEAARHARRVFFGDVARRSGARYIVLGHSREDDVETVIHRLLRGTGPAGLTGIAPFRSLGEDERQRDFVVARPMIRVARRLIRDALIEQGFEWREDGSNRSNQFSRNWIRNELLPLLQAEYPDAVESIARAIDGQQQWASCIESLVEQWKEANVIRETPLTIRFLETTPRSLSEAVNSQAVTVEAMRRIWLRKGWPLQSMGQPQWNLVFRVLVGGASETTTLPGAVLVRPSKGRVTFVREGEKSHAEAVR